MLGPYARQILHPFGPFTSLAAEHKTDPICAAQCTCRHVSYMEETFESLARFYQTFPMFTRYINLFSSSPSLRLCMQDLYSTYSDFCLRTIKYMRKGPIGRWKSMSFV